MNRISLRKRQRISYYEPEEPKLDEYVFCDQCTDFVFEYCSIHGPLLVIPDDKVKPGFPPYVPRAALTIPHVFLHIAPSTIAGAGLGVFTTLTLPRGVRFGPYRGQRSDEVNSMYCWQCLRRRWTHHLSRWHIIIFGEMCILLFQLLIWDGIHDGNNKRSHVVDAGDENRSNWMRYVNCARFWAEQNLVAYQYRGQMYYRTIKTIPRFTELMVFYGSEFACLLKVDLSTYNAPPGYAQKFGAPLPKKQKKELQNNMAGKIEAENNTAKKIQSKTSHFKTATVKSSVSKLEKENINGGSEMAKRDSKLTKVDSKLSKVDSKLSKVDSKLSKVDSKVPKVDFDVTKVDSKMTIVDSEVTKVDSVVTKVDSVMTKVDSEVTKVDSVMTKVKTAPKLDAYKTKVISKGTIIDSGIIIKGSNEAKMHFNKFECNHCGRKYNAKSFLAEHMKVHIASENAYFKCTECSYENVSKNILDNHMRYHDKSRLHQCNICSYRFKTSSKLKRHKLRHSVEINCDICEFKCLDQCVMEDHLLKHAGLKPVNSCLTEVISKLFTCTICDKTFKLKGNLKTHLRSHTGDRPYRCTVCCKSFIDNSNLKAHMRSHTGDRPHRCTVCCKSFIHNSNLKAHMRSHTGDRPHRCTVCCKSFIHNSHLKDHMRSHTGDRPYICTVCCKSFTQNSNLGSHMRTHTSAKPYSCTLCNVSFKHRCTLKTHMRTHTGEKPYNCKLCLKCFRKNDHLKRHMRSHTEEKPYRCIKCCKTFKHSCTLKNHMKTHTT